MKNLKAAICSLALVSATCIGLGCSGQQRHSGDELNMPRAGVNTVQSEATHAIGVGASNISNHLYMLALAPTDAFQTKAEREALWRALRGEAPRYLNLLGPVDDIPMDYRIEYVFNHTTPDSPDAEMENVRPWLKRLSQGDRDRVAKAQTVLLVKGSLQRLRNSQETRLTLAALTFLAETYDGVVFDLLNRQALSAQDLRQKLTDPDGLAPQVRFIGASVDGKRGVRSVGLPKYGLFDVFLASAQPRKAARDLAVVVDALLKGKLLPMSLKLENCVSTKLDYGCYQVLSR
jgi:hypothetical protein